MSSFNNFDFLSFATLIFLLCHALGYCIDYPEVDYLEDTLLIGGDDCGRAPVSGPMPEKLNKRILNRISNGYTPPRGAFPFYVAILETGMFGSRCGGTLISNRHIITAAHCSRLSQGHTASVFLGDEELEVKVEKRCVSKKFELFAEESGKPEGIYDIAVYKLDRDIEFTDTIQPACLPRAPLRCEQAYVTGEGMMGDDFNLDMKLNAIPMKRINCLERDRHETILCTRSNLGYNGSGCPGDSGGPLVSIINAQWTVFGAVSYGRSEGCPQYDIENQFADVFALRKEIEALLDQCQ